MSRSDIVTDRPQRTPIRAAVDIFDAIATALAAGVQTVERSLIYHPSEGRVPPESALPGAISSVIETSDGERVLAWGVAPPPGRPVVLYFHGTGETVYSRPHRFRNLVKAGFGVVGLSYRGYASSTGAPSEQGLHRDADALYRHIRSCYPDSPVTLWGYSLGSGVAVRLASEYPVGSIVLEAPYTSIAEVGSVWFPYMPVKRLMRDQFRSDEWISKVTAPVLVMHGKLDTVVPAGLGEKLFALANEPKRLVLVEYGDHMNLDRYGATRMAIDFIAGAGMVMVEGANPTVSDVEPEPVSSEVFHSAEITLPIDQVENLNLSCGPSFC